MQSYFGSQKPLQSPLSCGATEHCYTTYNAYHHILIWCISCYGALLHHYSLYYFRFYTTCIPFFSLLKSVVSGSSEQSSQETGTGNQTCDTDNSYTNNGILCLSCSHTFFNSQIAFINQIIFLDKRIKWL